MKYDASISYFIGVTCHMPPRCSLLPRCIDVQGPIEGPICDTATLAAI